MKKPLETKFHPEINSTLIPDAVIPYIADGGTIVFFDDCKLTANDWIINHNPIPFMGRNGKYWGYPADAAAAIKELKKVYSIGATHLVLVWTTFWWLDYYKEWYKYLCTNFSCVLENERLIIFNLKNPVNEPV